VTRNEEEPKNLGRGDGIKGGWGNEILKKGTILRRRDVYGRKKFVIYQFGRRKPKRKAEKEEKSQLP